MYPDKQKTNEPTAAIVIPARMGATRFPGKPLAEARGMPLLFWAWSAALDAKKAAVRFVLTDSEEIEKCCRAHGIDAVCIKAEHPTGTDRIAAYIRGRHPGIEVVVNLQCDEPELNGNDLDALIEAVESKYGVGVATFAFDSPKACCFDDPNAVKVIVGEQNQAVYFSRCPLPSSMIHVGVYAFKRNMLQSFGHYQRPPVEMAENLEQLRLLYHGESIRVLKLSRSVVSINTPGDLERWNDQALP